jgi:hypothetical protein
MPSTRPRIARKHGAGLAAVAVRARDEQVEAGAADRAVEAADQLREELSVDVGQEDADRVRCGG